MIVSGGTVVTMDKKRRVIKDGAIVIGDDRIVFVGTKRDAKRRFPREDEIDAEGKVIFPGFINAHTHMFQVLLRGTAFDLPLLEWLKKGIWPFLEKFRENDVYVGGLLGCVENIKSGVTCVVDNHYPRLFDPLIRAVAETGVRGLIPRGFYETNVPDELAQSPDEILTDLEKLVKKWHGANGGRIMIGVAPMIAGFATRKLLLDAKEVADRYGLIYHVHISETMGDLDLTKRTHGKRDVELFKELGILGPRFHAVHSVWVSDEDIETLALSGSHVVHNPVSNMYLGSGVAPVPEMLAAGVNVALGTDGPASNNNQDIIQSMKFAACLHKVNKLDPAIISAKQVLEMATLGGARALGLEHEIGSLEAGKKADITIVDMQRPHIAPVHDPVASLVYCANCGDVDSVFIDGKLVMENGVLKNIDEKKIVDRANKVIGRLKEMIAL
jgi:5-methylthioadenosine/S-adenosylhomocysteine deaminase